MLRYVCESGIRFVTTSAGSPAKLIAPLKAAGITVSHAVPFAGVYITLTGRRQLSWPPCCLTKECYPVSGCRFIAVSRFHSLVVEGCGHVGEGCGGGQRKARSAALSTVAPGAPNAHRPYVHSPAGRAAASPCGSMFFGLPALTFRPFQLRPCASGPGSTLSRALRIPLIADTLGGVPE